LKNREAEQLRELQKTREAIAIERAKLEPIPTLVTQVKGEYSAFTRQAKLHHSASKSIPRSDEEDLKHIADVDGIRL
jgi:hypothetical protein